MSPSNPILPPGSPLQGPQRDNNSKLLVSMVLIVAVHACVLSALLIQGCKRQDTGKESAVATNEEPPFARVPAPPTPAPEQPTASAVPSVATPQTNTPVLPPPQAAASNFVVTPPPMEMVAPGAAPSAAKPAVSGNPSVYVVKKGDTLTRVAKAHGVSVPAIRAANALKTDRLLVGQKLKIPAGEANSPKAEGSPMPGEPAPSQAAPQ